MERQDNAVPFNGTILLLALKKEPLATLWEPAIQDMAKRQNRRLDMIMSGAGGIVGAIALALHSWGILGGGISVILLVNYVLRPTPDIRHAWARNELVSTISDDLRHTRLPLGDAGLVALLDHLLESYVGTSSDQLKSDILFDMTVIAEEALDPPDSALAQTKLAQLMLKRLLPPS